MSSFRAIQSGEASIRMAVHALNHRQRKSVPRRDKTVQTGVFLAASAGVHFELDASIVFLLNGLCTAA